VTVEIEGNPTNCQTGQKSHFFAWNNELGSVEALAVEHYSLKENGEWQGVHCENGLFHYLFGLLMAEQLFEDIPHVFQTRFQDAPLDLGTCDFYRKRRAKIERRLELLRRADKETIASIAREAFARMEGARVRGVRWDRWDVDSVAKLCQCIGGRALAHVCMCFAQDYQHWCGGLPDLFLWNEERSECKLVEVKGPNDRLSFQQKAWLHTLATVFRVEVLKVKRT